MNLTHTEVVEYRQRIADMQRKRGEAADAEMKLRRWLDSLSRKYTLVGIRHDFDAETGEIVIHPETIHYQGWQSVFNAEKAAEGQNVWTEAPGPTVYAETGR